MFVNRIGEKESFERSKEIEKDVLHVFASMGQRKNSESPQGIEQTKKTHFDLFNPNLSLITTLICAMFFAVDSCKCSKCLLWCNQSAAEEECGKERPNG